jgi:hypothetical protein
MARAIGIPHLPAELLAETRPLIPRPFVMEYNKDRNYSRSQAEGTEKRDLGILVKK